MFVFTSHCSSEHCLMETIVPVPQLPVGPWFVFHLKVKVPPHLNLQIVLFQKVALDTWSNTQSCLALSSLLLFWLPCPCGGLCLWRLLIALFSALGQLTQTSVLLLKSPRPSRQPCVTTPCQLFPAGPTFGPTIWQLWECGDRGSSLANRRHSKHKEPPCMRKEAPGPSRLSLAGVHWTTNAGQRNN